ncbi:MAG: hypothetical protein ABIC04_01340 [Nanoarchaeota archaeon]
MGKKINISQRLLVIAAGISFLGNLAASWLWNTSNDEVKFFAGLAAFIGFFLLVILIGKGLGKI